LEIGGGEGGQKQKGGGEGGGSAGGEKGETVFMNFGELVPEEGKGGGDETSDPSLIDSPM